MITRLFVPIIALFGVVAVGSWTAMAAEPNVFRARYLADIESIDWQVAAKGISAWPIKNLMDGLFENDGDAHFQPRLARSYEASPDGLKLTFHLREGVKWSDGRPLLAQDFVDSWLRLLDPRQAYPYAILLFDIENAEAYRQGKLADPAQVGVRATGPLTLEVRLKKPAPLFPKKLSMWSTFPIRKDLITAFGDHWVDPEKLVVLGPYLLERRVPGKLIVLRRNENYWAGPARVARVELHILPDETEALERFKEGKLDYLITTDVKQVAAALGESARHLSFEAFRTTYLAFMMEHGPTASAPLRRAVAMAIDRKALAAAFETPQSPADSFVPPRVLPGRRGLAVEFAPRQAVEQLRKAGLKPLEPLKLLGPRGGRSAELLTLVAEQLKTNLGVSSEIRLFEQAPFGDALATGAGSAFLMNWGADYVDPYTFMTVFLSNSGVNPNRYASRFYDDAVGKALLESNAKKKTALYQEALTQLQSHDVAILPLLYNRYDYFLQPRVKAFVVSPMGDVYFRQLEVEPLKPLSAGN